MIRAALSLSLCTAALALGLYVAFLASANRAHAGDLDRRQQRCETIERQVELQHALNSREEWILLHEARTQASESTQAPVSVSE